jgi:hypothetical protein
MNRYEAVGRALHRNAGVEVRSEKLKNYNTFIVDPVDLSSIETNANQLVLGRRGTGKTLVLGALTERINERFPENKRYAFYYSAVEFRSSPDGLPKNPSVKASAHSYFHSFIHKLANDILVLADQVIDRPGILGALGLTGDSARRRRDKLIDVVLHLVEAAAIGRRAATPSSVAEQQRYTEDDSSGRSIRGGVSAASRGLSPSASYERSSRRGTHQEYTLETQASRVFDPSLVRSLLRETIELLELDYIVIMIDEWMTLGSTQIAFAERLRQCLFGDSRISVKIAADQYQGRFNNAGHGYDFRGLEIDADIYPVVDLDVPFRDERSASRQYAEILYRRLLYLNPDIQGFFGSPPLSDHTRFVTSAFENMHAFEEVCRGSQGICRSFHEIVKDCSKELHWTFTTDRISYSLAQDVLVQRSERAYDKVLNEIDNHPVLVELIVPMVRASGSKYFFVERGDSRAYHIIEDLLSKRFIHPVALSRMHPSVKLTHRMFEIDYGIYLDLMRAREFTRMGSIGSGVHELAPERLDLDAVRRYVISLDSLNAVGEHSTRRWCPSCGAAFSESEAAFEQAGLCPKCFHPQSEG